MKIHPKQSYFFQFLERKKNSNRHISVKIDENNFIFRIWASQTLFYRISGLTQIFKFGQNVCASISIFNTGWFHQKYGFNQSHSSNNVEIRLQLPSMPYLLLQYRNEENNQFHWMKKIDRV